MTREDKWLGFSPGEWGGDDGSLWGWPCRSCLPQSLECLLSHSLCPGKTVDTEHRVWSGALPAPLDEP